LNIRWRAARAGVAPRAPIRARLPEFARGRALHRPKLAKTPGQLEAAIDRLTEDGLLAIHGSYAGGHQLLPEQLVLPTAVALRTLEAF